jgi:adenine-specific DNA-methyltransferase
MAQRAVANLDKVRVRVLEPAAGAGILAAATVAELIHRENPPELIELTLYEIDERLGPVLSRLADRMRRAAKTREVRLKCSIKHEDFLLSETAIQGRATADVIIANPPYLKLGKCDPRAAAHVYAVHGQPNIYGLFLAACARLLEPEGRYCFITPRSWLSGAYFGAVRRQVLQWLRLDSLHIFESRRDHFSEDEILQEAMILWATARPEEDKYAAIQVSRSQGAADLANAAITAVPFARLVGTDDARMIALHDQDEDPFRSWTATLSTYGLQVSTGPVVAFRASDHIRTTSDLATVPLLWMQHVQPMQVRWPIQKKREHIRAVSESAWMLVTNNPMVLLRRFSPTEASRRITAAPYTGSLPGAVIGIENHLNYLYRPGGVLTIEEATGFAAFLGSRLVDAHFRAVAGSTQVNATDLRKLPLPAMNLIREIGRRALAIRRPDEIDAIVDGLLVEQSQLKTKSAA